MKSITISFGRFEFDGKSHTVNKEGVTKYRVKFKDEHDNKLNLSCSESDFEKYDEGSYLDLESVLKQSTLKPGGQ